MLLLPVGALEIDCQICIGAEHHARSWASISIGRLMRMARGRAATSGGRGGPGETMRP